MPDSDFETHCFEGISDGPSFTVLGAVHGNEKNGTEAINKIITLIKDGDIEVRAGKVTFIPICNPRAYKQDVRFTERNLNRFMYPKDNPKHYEDHLDNILCPLLEQSNYVLDIHSYSSQGNAFIFLSQLGQASIDFARSLGAPRLIYGWAEAMQNNEDLEDKRQAWGTTEYAREHGALAVTLECGNHANDNNTDVAINAILGALEYLGLADINPDLRPTNVNTTDQYNIHMQGAFLKLREGAFTQNWTNMHKVKKGETIARYDDGEEIIMPENGYIVLPMYDPTIGDQWFFWGVESPLEG